jgi:plasmid stability protein
MRTTIRLDDEVFRAYKQRAADRGTTLAQEIEDALRADLHSRRDLASEPQFETLVFDGDSSPALIDINDNEVLHELMDDEERDRGRS